MNTPDELAATVRRYLDDAYPLDSAAHGALAELLAVARDADAALSGLPAEQTPEETQ